MRAFGVRASLACGLGVRASHTQTNKTMGQPGVMEWRDARIRPQKANPKLVAGALAQHLSKTLGAESTEAKKMVLREVLEFSGQKQEAGREMSVWELSDLESSLKKKLIASQDHIRVTRPVPKSSLHPGSLPGVSDNYMDEIKKKMADAEAMRHRKHDRKGRGLIREILQAKTNDPWAVMNRTDSELYAQETKDKRQGYKRQQQKFRTTLDDQIKDQNERKKKALDKTHEEWREDEDQYKDWLASQKTRQAKIHQNIQDLMVETQDQLAVKADYRRREKELRTQEQINFRTRIEAEMEKARQEEEARREYNINLMKGYVKETQDSEALKLEHKKAETRFEEKAKRENTEMLDKSEREYAEGLARMKARQDLTEKRGVGKTWERRYIPDHVQEKDLVEQNKKMDHEEAMYWARKHHMRTDLVDGLEHQLAEMSEKRRFANAEKKVWANKYKEIAENTKREHEEEVKHTRSTQKTWKKDLDENLKDFRYKEAYEPYAMHRVDRVHNHHFGILSMGF